uniref:28S ribosomal protein S9, mitochondrial n=1 Tax=Trichogramma kaykai TaxID=54128 RepID=A0ABD2WLC1_9HYME
MSSASNCMGVVRRVILLCSRENTTRHNNMSANILTSLSCKNVNVVSNLVTKLSSRLGNVRLSSTVADAAKLASNVSEAQPPPEKKINKAMLAYLERAKAHDSFILKEKTDFQIGKRHLANMMGENPETFTQDDIDRAIEYLFPSGLFDKAARPIMKPPEEIFPPKKAAEFDLNGRPFHFLFYTTRPQYYEMLYTMVEEMQKLNAIEDDMISQNVAPKEKLDMGASDWMTHLELEKFLIENVDEKHYEYFLSTAKRLAEHPWAFMAKDTIMKYRAPRTSLIQSFDIPDVEYDAEGRPFITVSDCMRKTARGEVTVKGKGSGKITVNGKPMYIHFPRAQDREQVSQY